LFAAVAVGALVLGAEGRAQTPPEQDPNAPIVSDQAFEEQLPSLDAPLEPIEAAPMPADVDVETLPDAQVVDPALTEPLPPLATFDVTPPPATTEDTAAPEPVRYTLELEGFEEVELEGRFRDLSALEDGDGEATNGAMVAARAREDEALAVRMLRSEGYYDATAVAVSEQVPDSPGRLRVVVTAAPGKRYHLGTITLTGPETVPPGLAREALPLKSGDPIVAAVVQGAEANVLLRLPEQGYPFASLGLRDISLDSTTMLGDYILPVDPGVRARFAGFTTEGDLAFDAEHVDVLSRFDRGDLYDRRMVDDLREAMVATNLFSSVSAEVVPTGEKAEDGSEYVNILVRQDAGPARSLTASGGYSTGQGLRVEGAWEHRNMFPPEGALRVAAVAGTQEQSASVSFRRSNAGKRDRAVWLSAEAGRRDYPAFQGYTAQLTGRVTRESTPIWQKRWTYAYGAELIATNEARTGAPRLALSDAFFIGGLLGQIGYDRSDSLLDPTKGFRLLARTNPEVSLGNGTNPYIRNLIEGSVYRSFGDSFVLAGRARLGSIYGIERDNLVPSRRFYGGGGGSVRGFGYQELGPKDLDNKPIGGRSLAEFALEGRYRFGNYGIVGFVDAGQVYEAQYPTFDSMRFGVGIGGRLYTNFGPLRVDVATPIGRKAGESRVAVYISIGQAF
jgi:translocation and assembly module TamA